jgi:hypothetical protein
MAPGASRRGFCTPLKNNIFFAQPLDRVSNVVYIVGVMNEVRRRMQEEDVQVSDIADAIGYDISGASLIVNGKRGCPRAVAVKIAEYLGTTTRKIFKKESDRDWYRAKVKKNV